MLQLKGLNKEIDNNEMIEIITTQYNEMAKLLLGFAGALICDADKEDLPWGEDFIDNLRNSVCPQFIKNITEQKDLIRSLLLKLYSENYEKLTASESYTLARALSFGIINEELGVKNLIDSEKYAELNTWLEAYKIKEDLKRIRLESYLKALKEEKSFKYVDYLKEIGGEYEKLVKEHWKGSPLIEYENPNSAMFLFFTKDELSLISATQPLNK